MNLLVATTRQYHPEHEWLFQGVRFLFESQGTGTLNWAVYDSNPDLRNEEAPQTHRLRLRSNSFHHQSLLPFSAVIVLGPDHWRGYATEILYGVLAKRALPLYLIDVQLPPRPAKLSGDEQRCLSRPGTKITGIDDKCVDFFGRYGLKVSTPVSPILFANCESKTEEFKPRTELAFVLETTTSSGMPVAEPLLRTLLALAAQRPEAPVLCPTLNDFMRFSTMFPGRCLYSCEARDYRRFLTGVRTVVTTSRLTALWANGEGYRSVWVSEESHPESNYPFIKKVRPEEITNTVERLASESFSIFKLNEWKTDAHRDWKRLLSTPDSSRSESKANEPPHLNP